MTELAYLGARDLARAIRRKQYSCVEVTRHFLDRIAQHNPHVNAVITCDAERALENAAAADAALGQGVPVGPLHGVPMTVKDAFEVRGMRTTAGAKIWVDHVSSVDAIAVERLKAAGAIILGKTNTPAFCADVQTYNPIFGTTHNPWDVKRTSGGSSGGSAAALACGMTPVEIGSDIAGSIRTPAAFCGVFGHKPSFDLVPARGHMPGPSGTLYAPDLGVMGPLARSVEDLALMLDIIAGPTPERAKAYRLQLPAARAHSLRGYRAAVWLEDPSCPLDSGVLSCLRTAVDTLERAGARIEPIRPSFELQEAYKVYRSLLDPIMSSGLSPTAVTRLERLATGAVNTDTDPVAAFARNALIRQRDFVVWLEFRERLRMHWQRFFEDVDVLLCPVAPVTAFAHDHSEPQPARKLQVNGELRAYDQLFVWNSLATCSHLPATVLPAGRSQGLPVGMQVIGPFLEDRTPLDFAGRASEVLGGFVPPPGY